MNKKEQLCQKWKSWLDEIGNELGWLLTGRDFFWRLQKIVESNKNIQLPAELHNWIADNYVAKVTTGIVRMTDHHKGTISLYWLIKGIENNPDVITREYFMSQWHNEFLKKMGTADRTFDMFAKVGEQRVDPERLMMDLRNLDEQTCFVKDFRDQWVAHFDSKRKIERMPTFGDVDDALDTIDRVWCKYSLLLTCSAPETRKPAIEPDWEAPLRHRWIEGAEQEES